ncbi:MAG: glycosyltransferase family 39 protein [Candidatus Aceula meridiana]|nr:glycosyltransferase family 39 protein [Candidatus Aceula meridiana]
MRNKLILLTAILLLGLCLRLHDLGQESLWNDEGYSVRVSHLSLSKIVQKTSLDVHPPLYYFILHYWMEWLGDSECSMRLLSVIFGFLSIFMIYQIGSFLFDRDVGLLGALFVALSKFHINYSQETRSYSLLSFLTLASMYSFIKLFKKESRGITSLAYIFFSTFLIYTHVYGLFIIIAQNIYFMILYSFLKERDSLNFKKWFFLQLTLFFFFIPWVKVFIGQALKIQEHYWIPEPTIAKVFEFLAVIPGSNLLLLLFSVLIFFAIVKFKNQGSCFNFGNFLRSARIPGWKVDPETFKKNFFLLIWLLMPIILPFIISKVSTPIFYHRYFIVCSSVFFLLAAKGAINIKQYSKYVSFVFIIVVAFLSLLEVNRYYDGVTKSQWREAAHYIGSKAKTQDLLLFNSRWQFAFFYYSQRGDVGGKFFPGKTHNVNANNTKNFESMIKIYDRIWFLHREHHHPKELIFRELDKDHRLINYKEYNGVKIFLFQKN